MQSAARRQKKKAVVQQPFVVPVNGGFEKSEPPFFMISRRHIGGCHHAVATWYSLVKKSLLFAAAHSTCICENRRFLSAHKMIPSAQMVQDHSGAFTFQPELSVHIIYHNRSPPLRSVSHNKLTGGQWGGNHHQNKRAECYRRSQCWGLWIPWPR